MRHRAPQLGLLGTAFLLSFAPACLGRTDAPAEVATDAPVTTAPASAPEIVVDGVGEPSAVAIDGEHVLVATRTTRLGAEDVAAGALFVKTTHAPKPLMLALDARGASFDALAADEGMAYVATSDGRILAEPISGGTARTLAELDVPATALATVAPFVFAAQGTGAVLRIDTRTGTATSVARFAAVNGLVRREASVVVAAQTETGGAIVEIPADGTPSVLATLPEAPCGIAAERREVAWTTSTSGDAPRAKLTLLESGAAAPRTLTEIDAFACAVAASGADLFFALSHDAPAKTGLVRAAGASLMRASAASGELSPIVSASAPRVHPGALAATSEHVYWLTGDAVVRLAK